MSDLKMVNRVIETRTYTYAELSEMFGTRDNQGIKRRLENMGIIFNMKGRGGGTTFEIQAITDPFKAFCILELGFDSRTDFRKLRNFLFYFFYDENFNWKPHEAMEEYLRREGNAVSRQTITGYLNRLERNDLLNLHGETVYYKVFTENDKQKHELISKEEYSAAWMIYWEEKEKGTDPQTAFSIMKSVLGGIPKKHYRPIPNAFTLDTYNKLVEYVTDSMLAEDGK